MDRVVLGTSTGPWRIAQACGLARLLKHSTNLPWATVSMKKTLNSKLETISPGTSPTRLIHTFPRLKHGGHTSLDC